MSVAPGPQSYSSGGVPEVWVLALALWGDWP